MFSYFSSSLDSSKPHSAPVTFLVIISQLIFNETLVYIMAVFCVNSVGLLSAFGCSLGDVITILEGKYRKISLQIVVYYLLSSTKVVIFHPIGILKKSLGFYLQKLVNPKILFGLPYKCKIMKFCTWVGTFIFARSVAFPFLLQGLFWAPVFGAIAYVS